MENKIKILTLADISQTYLGQQKKEIRKDDTIMFLDDNYANYCSEHDIDKAKAIPEIIQKCFDEGVTCCVINDKVIDNYIATKKEKFDK